MIDESGSCQNKPSNVILLLKFSQNELKKGTLKIQKSKTAILVLNQSPISAVFQIVWLSGDQKTALTGESLYPISFIIETSITRKRFAEIWYPDF